MLENCTLPQAPSGFRISVNWEMAMTGKSMIPKKKNRYFFIGVFFFEKAKLGNIGTSEGHRGFKFVYEWNL